MEKVFFINPHSGSDNIVKFLEVSFVLNHDDVSWSKPLILCHSMNKKLQLIVNSNKNKNAEEWKNREDFLYRLGTTFK